MRILSTYIFIYGLMLCTIISCTSKTNAVEHSERGRSENILYAKGFTITNHDSYYSVKVRNASDTNIILQEYILYRNENPIAQNKNAISLQIPINDLVCLSTTHLAFLEALNVEDRLIGFSGVEYIYSENINHLVDQKRILDIGMEGGLNEELLVSLQPDIIMAYNTGNAAYDHFDKMQRLQLVPVINNEYLELTPLGQAEWIKFVSVFFDKLDYATQLFDSVAMEYNEIIKITQSLANKPTVFTGMSFKGEWTIAGGNSFAATFLLDAGAAYLWSEDDRSGNFPVSFEEVIDKAKDADFWLHAGAAHHLEEITNADIRFNYFEAYKNGSVYNNNKKVNSFGGNDYWESAVFAPHIVLKDLVKIFHPELMQAHEFVYYKKL